MANAEKSTRQMVWLLGCCLCCEGVLHVSSDIGKIDSGNAVQAMLAGGSSSFTKRSYHCLNQSP